MGLKDYFGRAFMVNKPLGGSLVSVQSKGYFG